MLDSRHKLSREFGKYPNSDEIRIKVLATEVELEAHAAALVAAKEAEEAALVAAARGLIGRVIAQNGGACPFWKLDEAAELYQCDILISTLRGMKRDGLVLFTKVAMRMPEDTDEIVTQLADLPQTPEEPPPDQIDSGDKVALSAGEEPVEQWDRPEARRKEMVTRVQAMVSKVIDGTIELFGIDPNEFEQVSASLRHTLPDPDADEVSTHAIRRCL